MITGLAHITDRGTGGEVCPAYGPCVGYVPHSVDSLGSLPTAAKVPWAAPGWLTAVGLLFIANELMLVANELIAVANELISVANELLSVASELMLVVVCSLAALCLSNGDLEQSLCNRV